MILHDSGIFCKSSLSVYECIDLFKAYTKDIVQFDVKDNNIIEEIPQF